MEINSLPNEILFLIFKLLDFKSQICVKSVCQLWQRLICQILNQQKYLLIHDTDNNRIQDRCGNFCLYGLNYNQNIPMISIKRFRSYDTMTAERYVLKIIPNFTNLRVIYLCLFNTANIQQYSLHYITSSCNSNLQHLTIIRRQYVQLHLREIKPFCDKFPNLKVFQFESVKLNVSEKSINCLLEFLKKLQVLILLDSIHSYERSVKLNPDDQIPSSFKHISQSIRVLKVPGNLMTLSAIEDMGPLKSLANLHICDFDGLRSVQLISQKFTNLLSLTLSSVCGLMCERDGDYLMENIGKLNRLKKLHLFIETPKRVLTYNSFSKLKNCQNLTTLQIESTILSSECIEAICRSVPQMKKFDLTYIEFENNAVHSISWIELLQDLECLKLSTIPELNENSVNNIIKRCTQLEYLDLSRSEQSINEIAFTCLEAANSRPHKTLTVYFHYKWKKSILTYQTIPKNLILKFPTVKYI